MKRRAYVTAVLGLMFLLATAPAPAQTCELYIANETVTGSEVTFDIYMLRLGDTGLWLGTSDFALTFSVENFTAPTLSIVSSGLPSSYGKGRSLNVNTIILNLNTPSFDEEQSSFEANVLNISNVAPGTLIARMKLTGVTNHTGSLGLKWSYVTVTAFTPAEPWPQLNITGSVSLLSPDETPLPITLASFTGNMGNGGVLLAWKTVSEVNNYGYTVQRKGTDDAAFADLDGAFVAGRGTTSEAQNYSYVDRSVTSAGAYAYRLKQVDLNGAVHYTQSVIVNVTLTDVAEVAPKVFQLMQNYPNPFNPSTQVKFSVEGTEHAVVKVYNLIGEEVATLFNGVAEAGRYYIVSFDASRLASGMYIYRLKTDTKTDVKKMLLVK
jgi:hypothetical protein